MPGHETIRRVERLVSDALGSLSPTLRLTALTHVSYANERQDCPSNERLEYLGDAVLQLGVGYLLYDRYSESPEGDLTRMRARLVSGSSLAEIASDAGLGKLLRLGRGEYATGGRERPRILAGAFEAVVGALFLELGWEWVLSFVKDVVVPAETMEVPVDAKTLAQERAQGDAGVKLEYRVLSVTGPDHRRSYEVECLINGVPVSRGYGSSKKEAEEQAASGYLAGQTDAIPPHLL